MVRPIQCPLSQSNTLLHGIYADVRKCNTDDSCYQRSAALNSKMWNEDSGLYLNRQWTSATQPGGGGGGGGKFSDVAAPTCFYPMLAGAANDTQVLRMVSRWLTNSTEFAVSSDPAPRTEPNRAMPSVSRSSSAFHDNSYWRGRAWGPMNWLVYLGLKNYNHLPEVKAVMAAMASQSEATFLVEWVQNHRVMENYNSVTGVGYEPLSHQHSVNSRTLMGSRGSRDGICSPSAPSVFLWSR